MVYYVIPKHASREIEPSIFFLRQVEDLLSLSLFFEALYNSRENREMMMTPILLHLRVGLNVTPNAHH